MCLLNLQTTQGWKQLCVHWRTRLEFRMILTNCRNGLRKKKKKKERFLSHRQKCEALPRRHTKLHKYRMWLIQLVCTSTEQDPGAREDHKLNKSQQCQVAAIKANNPGIFSLKGVVCKTCEIIFPLYTVL